MPLDGDNLSIDETQTQLVITIYSWLYMFIAELQVYWICAKVSHMHFRNLKTHVLTFVSPFPCSNQIVKYDTVQYCVGKEGDW